MTLLLFVALLLESLWDLELMVSVHLPRLDDMS